MWNLNNEKHSKTSKKINKKKTKKNYTKAFHRFSKCFQRSSMHNLHCGPQQQMALQANSKWQGSNDRTELLQLTSISSPSTHLIPGVSHKFIHQMSFDRKLGTLENLPCFQILNTPRRWPDTIIIWVFLNLMRSSRDNVAAVSTSLSGGWGRLAIRFRGKPTPTTRLSFWISRSGPSSLTPPEKISWGGVGSEFNQYKSPNRRGIHYVRGSLWEGERQ